MRFHSTGAQLQLCLKLNSGLGLDLNFWLRGRGRADFRQAGAVAAEQSLHNRARVFARQCAHAIGQSQVGVAHFFTNRVRRTAATNSRFFETGRSELDSVFPTAAIGISEFYSPISMGCIPRSELHSRNSMAVDIPSASVTTQGAYAQVVALRPEIIERLPKFDIALVDKLETYALAMFCAHMDYRAAMDPPAELAALVEKAIEKRAILLADVNTLIAYGILAPDVTSDLLGVVGYKNVMTDLGTLASVLRANADKVAGRTSVKATELAEAEDLVAKLGKTVGVRELSPQAVAQVTRHRQAAFTLFMKAYEEVRSAILYLRHHEGDGDSIMPSLFAGRGGRKKVAEEPANKPNAPAATTGTGSNNQPSTPTANPAQPAKIADISESGPYMHG